MTVLEFLRSKDNPAEINRRGLLAIRPVVVDASALISDVYWHLNMENSRVLATAELGSVRLFAPTSVYGEVYRNLPKLAYGKNAGRLDEAIRVWEDKYLPLVRWCRISWQTADSPLVSSVSHINDRPLAAVATAIAPCHVWSDNYKHLGGVGVARPNTPESWRSQAQATGTVAGAAGLTMAGTIPVIATAAGIKEGVSFLAKRPRLGIGVGVVALAGVGLGAFQLRGRGQAVKERIGGTVSALAEAISPIVEAYNSGQALLRRCELVIGSPMEGAFAVAHILAVSPRPLLMREIVDAAGNSPGGDGLTVRDVGGILRSSQIFERLANGRWQVGYIGAARTQSPTQAITTTTP